jgi:hypothetical protein
MALEIVVGFGLFVTLLGAMEIGRWARRRMADSDSYDSTAADAVVFGVLGLLIAFTFNSAASRFDERRDLINDQANALRVSWTRLDLLPEPDREPIRACMREWVELVMETIPNDPDPDSPQFNERMNRARELQQRAWHLAMESADRQPKPQYAALVLNPIDQWIDLSATRLATNNRGMPTTVMIALVALALAAAVLAGFHAARHPRRSLLHMIVFAGVIAMLLYLMVDLMLPRSGLIRVKRADKAMQRLYEEMIAESPATTKPSSR